MWTPFLSLARQLQRALALALLGGLLVSAAADAATFPNLYQVTVAPDPAAADQQAAAIELALGRLLVRITGNRDAALDPELQRLLAEPRRYLNSYGLVRQGQAQVGFIPGRIDQALTELNFPVWGQERPLTLLWIAVDDGLGGRALLGANTAAEEGAAASPAMAELLTAIRTELAAVADERGLPLTLPLLDLEDLSAVTFTDVWGGFDDLVARASARYRADAVLIGRVRPGLFGNEVQWLLLRDGTRAVVAGGALRDGLDAVANLSAAELSTRGGARTARLTVLDVVTWSDYGRVMSYLEAQSVFESVDVESFDRGALNVRVAARGDTGVLERVLALGSVLSPAGNFGGSAAPAGALVFRIARGGTPR
jgi:hypothetical protein